MIFVLFGFAIFALLGYGFGCDSGRKESDRERRRLLREIAQLQRAFDTLWARYVNAMQRDTDAARVEQFLKTL